MILTEDAVVEGVLEGAVNLAQTSLCLFPARPTTACGLWTICPSECVCRDDTTAPLGDKLKSSNLEPVTSEVGPIVVTPMSGNIPMPRSALGSPPQPRRGLDTFLGREVPAPAQQHR